MKFKHSRCTGFKVGIFRIRTITDIFYQLLVALDRCLLNTGSFTWDIVWGDPKMAVKDRCKLNIGGCKYRLDCIGKEMSLLGFSYILTGKNIRLTIN